MTRADALIIGAGPAGALAALLLARSGERTMLVEKRAFPRHKVCGCCIAPLGRAVLERSGASGALRGGLRVSTLEVRHRAGRVRTTVPGYTLIGRDDLDHTLARLAAEAGADVRFGEGAQVLESGGVTVGCERVDAGVVLVADGIAGSSLRAWDRFSWDVRPGSRIGTGCVVEREAPSLDAITMCVGDGGYCGVAPLPGGRSAVAAALSTDAVRDGGAHAAVSRLLDEAGVDLDFPVDALAGAPTLTRTRRAVEADGRVFVVGDGAGYIEPFTGEGMSWALRSAELAHAHALAALRGAYTHGAWTRDVGRVLRREKLGCRAVTAVLRRPRLTAACARVARVSPGLSGFVARRVVAA